MKTFLTLNNITATEALAYIVGASFVIALAIVLAILVSSWYKRWQKLSVLRNDLKEKFLQYPQARRLEIITSYQGFGADNETLDISTKKFFRAANSFCRASCSTKEKAAAMLHQWHAENFKFHQTY